MEVAFLQFATRPKSTQVEPFRHVAPERLVNLESLMSENSDLQHCVWLTYLQPVSLKALDNRDARDD